MPPHDSPRPIPGQRLLASLTGAAHDRDDISGYGAELQMWTAGHAGAPDGRGGEQDGAGGWVVLMVEGLAGRDQRL
jgi:hypothetical protein